MELLIAVLITSAAVWLLARDRPAERDDPQAAADGASPPRIAPPAPRLLELDALRGLAALAVVFFHLTTVHERDTGFIGQPSLDIWWGAKGVELFFVISGFVIFMTLQNTRRPLDFIMSRFARLYPAYWAAILFTTAIVALLRFELFYRTPAEIAVNFTMLQGLPGLGVRDVDLSYWTLYTELLFYTSMLTLFVTGQLRRIELYLWAALAGAISYHVASHFAGAYLPASSWVRAGLGSLQNVIPYAPLFVIGICLYRIWIGTKIRHALVILSAALSAIWATMLTEEFLTALLAVGIFSLVLTGRAGFLRSPPLVWLGGISYSLYLVHSTAGQAMIFRLETIGWTADAAIAAAFVAMVGAAMLINLCVERPAQRALRNAYKRHRSSEQPSGFAPGL